MLSWCGANYNDNFIKKYLYLLCQFQ